jgi:hypothetical protein
VVTISASDFLWWVDLALDAMVAIISELGDDAANRAPDLPGANSPFAILTHSLGVMEYWGGHMVADRPITRDRDAEFRATGPLAPLIDRVGEARRQLEKDIAAVDSAAAPPHPTAYPEDADLPFGRTQGGVLVHILEELFQHLGQMELTRDILRSTT